MVRKLYPQRRLMRGFEKAIARVEGWINRVGTPENGRFPFNPMYHLGTLSIFLLVWLAVTGIYLTIFYRPGTDRAYETVAAISATWLGSFMRTSHRYASDGLILITLLHAIKTLFSDRFWGSRWLAWVSGWALLILFWFIGSMGYFLVWDAPAQWLTEYAFNVFQGEFALAFLGPEIASSTFSFFVIILFLHAFIPILLVVGIIIHVLRLTRVKVWTPRWIMAETGLVLVLLSLWQPVSSTIPADLGRLVEAVHLDWFYLGFLPLTARFGNPLFWGISLLFLAGITALPWLGRGRHMGPATVTNPNCTGCSLCARECPYDAIQVISRQDESRFKLLAEISPQMCTGCGICVGTCATSGIELAGVHSTVIKADINRKLAQATTSGEAPVAIFTCERQAALGTLPAMDSGEYNGPAGAVDGNSAEVIPILTAPAPARVNLGHWNGENRASLPLLTCVLPCVGMLHPEWVKNTLAEGARAAIVLSCPADDCSFREGPKWVYGRFSRRRRTLPKDRVFYLEAAPTSRNRVSQILTQIGKKNDTALVDGRRESKPGANQVLQLKYMAAGFIMLLLTFALSILFVQPAKNTLPDQGKIQIAMNHGGNLMAASEDLPPEILAKLPDNVDPAMVLGGERFPVRLRLEVDGNKVLENVYQPRGLRREGAVYGLDSFWLPPGKYAVQVWLMDDGTEWESVYQGEIEIIDGDVRRLYFNEETGFFDMK